jgi:catechol 2,3-dioxygenase-like lactoylglutathione lyase family enzyme
MTSPRLFSPAEGEKRQRMSSSTFIMKKIAMILALIPLFQLAFRNEETKSKLAPKPSTMKMNAGIVTSYFKETKDFYIRILNFEIAYENEFYVLMRAPGTKDHISFLKPNHPSQKPIFQPAFTGKGVYLTIEVEDLESEYDRIKALGIAIEIEPRNEPWGERHFAIVDPNGIGIDIVTPLPG